MTPLLKNTLNRPLLQTSMSRWTQVRQGAVTRGEFDVPNRSMVQCLIVVLLRADLGGIPDRSVQSCTSTSIRRGGDEGKRDPASQFSRLSNSCTELRESGRSANVGSVACAGTDERGTGDEILFTFTSSTSGVERRQRRPLRSCWFFRYGMEFGHDGARKRRRGSDQEV